jgi:beta-lactamase class D
MRWLPRFWILAWLIGCTGMPETIPNPFPKTRACFLLYNLKARRYEQVVGDDFCRQRLPASSTFKVPLALMAFDSGAIKNPAEKLMWDGQKQLLQEWQRDHDARSWMRDSVVWFSQRLTGKMGEQRVQSYLRQFRYGNQDLSAGITRAWLVSPGDSSPSLRISAYEQIEFLTAMWDERLGVDREATKRTKELLVVESSGQAALMGKTGSNFYDSDRKIRLGWFIGHLRKGDLEYLVCTVFRDLEPSPHQEFGGAQARKMTKSLLRDRGLW